MKKICLIKDSNRLYRSIVTIVLAVALSAVDNVMAKPENVLSFGLNEVFTQTELLEKPPCTVSVFFPECATPSPLPPKEVKELYVLPLPQNQLDLETIRTAGFEPSGQLAGNDKLAPNGTLIYLDEIEAIKYRDRFGFAPIPYDDFPWEQTPIHHDLMACDHPVPLERYCAYMDTGLTADRCGNRTIESQLEYYDALPAFGGEDYAVLVDLGPTHEGRPTYALRIGKNADKGGVPTAIVYATQHGLEWTTTDAAMSLIEHFIIGYTEDSAVRSALQNVVLTVVPVANPDGYEHTFSAETREYRANRNPACIVDPNRNFPFSATQLPGAVWFCDKLYHGKNPDLDSMHPLLGASEPETVAAETLLSDADFPAAIALNVHSYGQLVLYTDGISEGFWPCGTDGNCTNADFAVQRVLGGTFRQPKFTDSYEGYPYRPGQLYRNIYAVSGGLTAHAHMDAGVIGFGVELGRGTCRFKAEQRDDSLNHLPAEKLISVVTELMARAPGVADGSFYDTHPELGAFTLPHLHRRHAEEHNNPPIDYPYPELLSPSIPGEQPTLRVSARTYIPNIDVFPENGDPALPAADDVLEGVAYRSWQWRPSEDPFVFPRRLGLCAKEANCEYVEMPGGGRSVDICRNDYFSATDGWAHQGRGVDPRTIQDQCYWYTTGLGLGELPSGESDVWTLGHKVDLDGIGQTHLVFSYKRTLSEVMDLTIKVSSSGTFDPCDSSTGCRVAYASRLPHGYNVSEIGGLRTEIVDISDHDGSVVHLRWELRDSSPTVEKIKIYDPVILGWTS